MEEEKKLYLSVGDKKIGGVCGGIATYCNVDPVLIRILAVCTLLCVGGGLLLYLILWAVLTKDPDPSHVFSGKRMYRSTSDKKLCGVLGGTAAYFGWDVGVVRLVGAILCVFAVGIIPYFIAAIILPKDTEVV